MPGLRRRGLLPIRVVPRAMTDQIQPAPTFRVGAGFLFWCNNSLAVRSENRPILGSITGNGWVTNETLESLSREYKT